MTSSIWSKSDLESQVDEIAKAAKDLDAAHPIDIVKWAASKVGSSIVVTCSFEDAVLADVVTRAVPGIEVVMIDTQYVFAETHWLANEVKERHNVNLRVVQPSLSVVPDNLWQRDTEACCNVRKVKPLEDLLSDATCWITGVRRVDGPTRESTPVVGYDAVRNVLKVNPLAAFSDDDMATYEHLYELPEHPLKSRGYASIGCWPCTRPVAPGEDKRAGRWSGQEKTECGLHV
jgi:phosphoadenosine phosphosulfate reductase